MRFIYFAAAAAALRIPAGLPSGTYMVGPDSDGNSVTRHLNGTIVGVEPGSSPVSNRDLEKRSSSTFCGCGIGLDHPNCDSAVQMLQDTVGHGATVDPWSAIFTVYHGAGSTAAPVAAFACNPAIFSVTVSAALIGWAAWEVTRACGWYIAGTIRSTPDGAITVLDLGYMNYYDGLDICANAETSGSQTC